MSNPHSESADPPVKLYIAVVALAWVLAAVVFTQAVAWGLPLVGYLMGISVGAVIRRHPAAAREPSLTNYAIGVVVVAALLARGSLFVVTAQKYNVSLGVVLSNAKAFAFIGPVISAVVASSIVSRSLKMAAAMAPRPQPDAAGSTQGQRDVVGARFAAPHPYGRDTARVSCKQCLELTPVAETTHHASLGTVCRACTPEAG